MNAPGPHRRPPRLGTLRSGVPALVGIVVVVALGAVAVRVGNTSLEKAEADRLSARTDLIERVVPTMVADLNANQLSLLGSVDAFTPGDTAANQTLLQRFLTKGTGDAPVLAALYGTDGQPLQTAPTSQPIDIATYGSAWGEAVGGHRAATPVFVHGGAITNAVLVPVARPGAAPWAVMALVMDALSSSRQALITQLGSFTSEPGGQVLVDPRGVTLNSWNAADIGRPAVTPETVRDLPTGASRIWTVNRNGVEVTIAGTRLPNGFALLFEQETDKLFGDLRSAQHRRDLTLLAVLAGTVAGLVIFQVSRDRAARRAKARTHALLENSEDLVVVADDRGHLSFVSPAIGSLLGHRAGDWTDRPLTDLAHPDDVERLRDLLDGTGPRSLLNVRLRQADGEHDWFDIEASDMRHHRVIDGMLLTCHAVGERKRLQDELTHQASHDALTDLPNRNELSARLDGLLAGDRPVRPFAFLYVDLDKFKPVNDSLGHDAGDQVLRVVSERFKRAAGPAGFVCRLGGDEFGVVVDGAGEPEAVALADRLRRAATDPIAVGSTLVHIDATIGVSLADPRTPIGNPEVLVRQADQAMYQAKRQGRGRANVAVPLTPVADAAPVADHPSPAAPSTPAPGVRPAPTAAAEAPAAAVPFERSRPRQRGSRLAQAAPVLVVAGIVISIAAVGFSQVRSAQAEAEHQRVTDYQRTAIRNADFNSRQTDPTRIIDILTNLPWTFDGSSLDQALTKGYADAMTSGKGGWEATLSTPDARVLTALPAGAVQPFTADSPVWRGATIDRRPSAEYIYEVGGALRSFFVMPVIRNGEVRGVLTVGVNARTSFIQQMMERQGDTGQPNGGWSLIGPDGVAVASWNPDLIGTKLAEPSDLAPVEPGQPLPSLASGSGRVVFGAVIPSVSSPRPVYLTFVQPADDFFHDLRVGRTVRDASLLIVVIAGIIGLAVLNHKREQAVRRSEQRLDTLLQHAHDIVVVLDPDGTATFVSSASVALLGYDPDERIGQSLLDLVHPDDRARLAGVAATARSHTSLSIPDVRVRHRDGTYHWFDIHAVDLQDHAEVGGVLLTCHEVGERKAAQDELAYQAEHDALTGLPNRTPFSARLEALAGAESADQGEFAVLFVDLDHFKPINDTFGHDAGDEVLRTVGGRLRASVRTGDGDRASDVVCRLGGDEFAILLLDITEERARTTAERILAAVAEPIDVAGTTVTVGATIGVALSHPGHEHPDRAVRNADAAMYHAKEAGRGRYTLASTLH